MASNNHHFLALPVELRTRICRYIFQETLISLRRPFPPLKRSTMLPLPSITHALPRLLSLLAVNRQIHNDSNEMVWQCVVGRLHYFFSAAALASIRHNNPCDWDLETEDIKRYVQPKIASRLQHLALEPLEASALLPVNDVGEFLHNNTMNIMSSLRSVTFWCAGEPYFSPPPAIHCLSDLPWFLILEMKVSSR